jgi:hypothetical protein
LQLENAVNVAGTDGTDARTQNNIGVLKLALALDKEDNEAALKCFEKEGAES